MSSAGLAVFSSIVLFLKEVLKTIISRGQKHDQIKTIRQASRAKGYEVLVRALKARRKAGIEFDRNIIDDNASNRVRNDPKAQ